jgi:periplasmic copper chaperone A
VSPSPSEVPAGGFTAVGLTVGHGCDGSPVTRLEIQVPESLLNVTPAIVPGWDAEVTTEPLDEPVEGSHGEEVTERESLVTYTAQAGSELPDGFRQTFTLGFQAPDTPGEYLFFKTIQVCEEGQIDWIEEYTGEGEEPENPSPAVLVTESEGGGHGGGSDEEPADDETTETTEAPDSGSGEESAAAPDPALPEDDDDTSNGLAIVALVAGLAGLGLGGAAFARSGKTAKS